MHDVCLTSIALCRRRYPAYIDDGMLNQWSNDVAQGEGSDVLTRAVAYDCLHKARWHNQHKRCWLQRQMCGHGTPSFTDRSVKGWPSAVYTIRIGCFLHLCLHCLQAVSSTQAPGAASSSATRQSGPQWPSPAPWVRARGLAVVAQAAAAAAAGEAWGRLIGEGGSGWSNWSR